MNWKIIFIPICWIIELYWLIMYGAFISGHNYIEQKNGSLKCEVCGKISKDESI